MNQQTSNHYVVGTNKPQVEIHVQPKDPYYYQRLRAAQKLNRDEESLNDEPDFNTRLDIDNE